INYVTNAHYTAWGALASLVNGTTTTFAGINTNNTYNPRLQPQTPTTSTTSGTIMSFGYNFNYGAGDYGNGIGNANGRTSTRPPAYGYDAENRLTAAAGIRFDYDADGRRVQKSSGKLYWYGADGNVLQETNLSGALSNEYVFFDGRRIARRSDGSYQSSLAIQN